MSKNETLAEILTVLKSLVDHVLEVPAPDHATMEVVDAVTRNYGRRRCDTPGRDALVYRAGSAFEVAGALDIGDYSLLGALVSPKVLAWLLQEAQHRLINDPIAADISIIGLLRAVLQQPAQRKYLINLGAWMRFRWDYSAYASAVAEFEAGAAAQGGQWRSRPVTLKQRYLIDEILRAYVAVNEPVPHPDIRHRGDAHDWIRLHHGNPRFWNQPAPPDPTDFVDVEGNQA